MNEYEPVLDYKMSFDPLKGEKNKMDVHYQHVFDEHDAEERPRTMKRVAEVRICESTSVEETLHTYDRFLREQKRTKMDWEDAPGYFMNCLGETPQLRLEKVQADFRRVTGGDYDLNDLGFKVSNKHIIN